MEWIGLQEFQKPLSAKSVNVSGMHFGYDHKNIQNENCISLYNRRTYLPACRYKAHEAGHGISRGLPHILISGGNEDADDFRT